MNLFKAIRLAMTVDKAETCLERRDHARARKYMDRVQALIGDRYDKPGLFSLHLIDARIFRGLNLRSEELTSLKRAIQAIATERKLKEVDRSYLLAYCAVRAKELGGSYSDQESAFSEFEYDDVSGRYRNRYPTKWAWDWAARPPIILPTVDPPSSRAPNPVPGSSP